MIPSDFRDYFTNSSTATQQEIVSSLLSLSLQGSAVKDDKQDKAITCPHCTKKRIRANGKLKGVQRYFCNDCKKNFSETTGKFWYGIKKKDKLSKYLYCLLSGYSIRKSAKETGISIQTSFDWRHKLLTSFSSVSVEEFQGIVESDDLFFAYSEKGNRHLDRKPRQRGEKASKAGISNEKVAVIATCDRSGNKDFKVATRGRISKKDLDKVLKGKLNKVEVICSDSHRSYGAFAKANTLNHKKFNASKGQRTIDKVYHVQNVNNMDMRLRKFMESFNGVATKYLQNYLNWFLVLEKIKNSTSKMTAVTAIASNSVWYEYKQQLFNMLIRT
ncbi:MAG: IS1595 family transposase [Flavobacteriaceae bacterium]|nr:MAG: IS1595 family transposase [Flavobacteriaceae bacterium]